MSDILAVDVDGTVENTVNQAANIGVKILAFLAIFVIGWIISKVLYKVCDKLLNRVGFNRLADRAGIRRWTGNYTPSNLIAKIIYYGLLLITLQLAFAVFGPNPISDLLNGVVAWLPRLLVGLVIVLVAAAVANAVFDIVHNALGSLSYGRMLARVAQVAILALGIIAALNQIGVATTVTTPVLIAALATIAGIAIVGVGGGMVKPMTERWERMLNKAETEGRTAAAHLRDSAGRKDSAFGQSSYQGRTGQAEQDVQRAAEKAARDAREAAQQTGSTGMPRTGA